MATAKKLPSGNWRVRVYVNGKYESVTAPTKREAELEAAKLAAGREYRSANNITLREAMRSYIDSKSNILSPATIRSYNSILQLRLQNIMEIPISKITRTDIQKAINTDAKDISQKTVRNAFGLLTATMKQFRPELSLKNIDLGKREKIEMYIPTDKEVSKLLCEAKGTEMELAIALAAMMGLRRSEITALTWRESVDMKNKKVHIQSALVRGADNEHVLKAPKSYAGNRTLTMPEYIYKLFLQQKKRKRSNMVFEMNGEQLYKRFIKLQKAAELPHFRFHDLRHYNASVMLALNIPNKYAAERMGHADDTMLKKVYQHLMEDKNKDIDDSIEKYFQGI